MQLYLYKKIFGDLENASEEERRLQGQHLVRVMFIVAILGITASLLIPHFYR
jgi:hypothetical protein